MLARPSWEDMADTSDSSPHSRFELLFENAPVAIWLEDFSAVHQFLSGAVNSGSVSLASLFDARPELVLEAIRRVHVIHVNRKAREFYQADTVQELTRHFPQLFDERTVQTFRDELVAFWEYGPSFEADVLTTTLHGETRLVRMNCAILPDQASPWSFVIVTFTDLTERQHFEQSLRDSERRAQSAAEDLKRTNQILARLNGDLERFAYAAAHDLREPLRTISLYAQLLVQFHGSTLTGHGDAAIRFILDGTKRMEQLIGDLLSFARVIEPTHLRPPASAQTSTVLGETLQILDAAIRESNALLHLEPLPTVAVEPGHLRQLFQNLIGNSVKYRSRTRRLELRISARTDAGRVILCFADNGEGIKPEYHERIFGIFQRLHGHDVQGSGIGLALCRRIAGLYNGRIWVESDGSNGSKFFIELPSVPADAAGQAAPEG